MGDSRMTLPPDPDTTVTIDAPTGVVQVLPVPPTFVDCVFHGFRVTGNKFSNHGMCRVCGAAAMFENHICPSCKQKEMGWNPSPYSSIL